MDNLALPLLALAMVAYLAYVTVAWLGSRKRRAFDTQDNVGDEEQDRRKR